MKLSIITINRNNATGLRKTIESVVNQTYTDYEYIIIDGASTDESVEVIKEYADKISYWVSEPDKGIYNAMNKGIEITKGEYVNFMNSGDSFYNDTVLFDVFNLNRTEDILYGNICLVKDDFIVEYTPFIEKPTLSHFINDSLCHQSLFQKRDLLICGYNEKYLLLADFDFLVNKIIVGGCSTFCIHNTICFFDLTGVSSDEKYQLKSFEERNFILHSYFSDILLSEFDEIIINKKKYSLQLYGNIEKLKSSKILFFMTRKIIKIFSIILKGIDKFKY